MADTYNCFSCFFSVKHCFKCARGSEQSHGIMCLPAAKPLSTWVGLRPFSPEPAVTKTTVQRQISTFVLLDTGREGDDHTQTWSYFSPGYDLINSFFWSPQFHLKSHEVKTHGLKTHKWKTFHKLIDHWLDQCQDEFNKGLAEQTNPKKLISN